MPKRSMSGPSLQRSPHFLRVSVHEQILFLKHLTIMLETGIPLREALEALQDQTESKALRYIMGVAIKDLSDGQPLTTTLERFPRVFDSFFLNIVRVGEASGTLPASLQYLAAQMEKGKRIEEQVRSALIYPVIIFFGAIGVGIYLAFFLLPQLLPLLLSLRVNLPFTTRALLFVTGAIRTHWILLLGGLAIIVSGAAALWRFSMAARVGGYRLLLVLPVLGNLFREVQIVQFARILGTLLTSGVHIVPALQVTANSLTNIVYRRALENIVDAVERGGTVEGALRSTPQLFSRTEISMVAIGERTGSLPKSLLALAEFMEHELETMTKNLTTLIEPVVLVLVGGLVGFIALSIVTPIYQLTEGLAR